MNKPLSAQRAQRNINSVISEFSVVDYPSGIYFLLISSNIPKVILWHIYMIQLDTMKAIIPFEILNFTEYLPIIAKLILLFFHYLTGYESIIQ